MHGDLVAIDGAVLELGRLGAVAQLDAHLVGADGILDMAQILAQIAGLHVLDDERGAIVLLVQRVLNRVLLGQGQRLAVLDEEADGNGTGAIVAVEFRGVALDGVDVMAMRGHLGAVLHIDGDHAVWRIGAAIVAEALIDAGVLLVHIVQHDDALGCLLLRGVQSLALQRERGRVGKR